MMLSSVDVIRTKSGIKSVRNASNRVSVRQQAGGTRCLAYLRAVCRCGSVHLCVASVRLVGHALGREVPGVALQPALAARTAPMRTARHSAACATLTPSASHPNASAPRPFSATSSLPMRGRRLSRRSKSPAPAARNASCRPRRSFATRKRAARTSCGRWRCDKATAARCRGLLLHMLCACATGAEAASVHHQQHGTRCRCGTPYSMRSPRTWSACVHC
jgi:hypothetical protein